MKNIMYGMVFAALVAGCTSPPYATEVQSVQLVKSTQSWNGQPLPAYETGTPEITILRITIPPKQDLPIHTHPVINAGVVLKGELTVTTDSGQVLYLKPNDPIVEVVDTWHYGRNNGDDPVDIIVFYEGCRDEPITVKKLK